MNCPDCGQPIERVCASRSVELQLVSGDRWIEKNVFVSNVMCSNCMLYVLDDKDKDILGITGY